MRKLINQLELMKSSRVANYVIAGLDSYLLENGKVRLFENSRNHQDSITPHSHRFDFTCLVLYGRVKNRLWSPCEVEDGDFFEESSLVYDGEIGRHKCHRVGRDHYKFSDSVFRSGDIYSMKAHEIHSIQFSKGAKVLFFEGPQVTNESLIIEPVVNGEKIPTYQSLPYMFKRDAK